MYEHLEQMRPGLKIGMSGLAPVSQSYISKLRETYVECPIEYTKFLEERGGGELYDSATFFFFASELLSAELDYYKDDRIYKNGAKGDVKIFGWDSVGTAFGFDSGDNWRLAEIDEYRIVTHLQITFKEFVEGLLICYPRIAKRFEDSTWYDVVGKSYRIFPVQTG